MSFIAVEAVVVLIIIASDTMFGFCCCYCSSVFCHYNCKFICDIQRNTQQQTKVHKYIMIKRM